MTAMSQPGIAGHAVPAAWKPSVAMLAMLYGWVFLLYWPTLGAMAGIWARSETFAHGFLVLPIVLWLAWRQRLAVGAEMPAPGRHALWIPLLAGLAWLAGELGAVNALSQFALVALLAGIVPVLAGWRVAWRLAFPLGFLFFAVPAGEFLMPWLMDWTAQATVMGLRLSGVPVYQEGREFIIPSGAWSVVEACSGIRYLIASLMVGTLFAYLNFHSLRRRLLFVGVSLIVPVLANWVRAYLIVMIGHLSGNRLATGVDHLIYGWVFFGALTLLVLWIGSRWARSEPIPPAAGSDPAAPGGRPPAWGSAGLLALVAALPVLAFAAIEARDAASPPALAGNPEILAGSGWRPVAGEAGQPLPWRPALRDAAGAWHQAFEKDGRVVAVALGYYRNQAPGRKLAASMASLVGNDDPEWSLAGTGRRQVDAGGRPLEANAARLQPQGPAAALVLWQWYWADGRATTSGPMARAYTAWSRLRGQGDDAAVVVLYAPAGQDGEGEAALAAFSLVAAPAINQLLNTARSGR